jgi:hypothetical protein
MGWVLTASGSLAGTPDLLERFPAVAGQAEQRRIERAEVTDAVTGAELRLTEKTGGGLQASLSWMELDVAKVVQANGDFHARIAARQDVLVLVRTGNRLRVTRGGQTALLMLDRADEGGLDQAQAVIAGSRALRTFRAVRRQLSLDSQESAPGVALDRLDALLGILQGDPGALDRRAPARRSTGVGLTRVSCGADPTCYGDYEAEVIRSWDDYVQCVDDVKWFPLMQEACAFTWLLRVESAWFHFIGCSSIPLKIT